MRMQGTLTHVQGVSLPGLQADLARFEAISRMTQLHILVLDGVKMQHEPLSGFQLPHLAMFSLRCAHGPSLPFALEAIESAAVLDISERKELESLPAELRVWNPSVVLHYADAFHGQETLTCDYTEHTCACCFLPLLLSGRCAA